LRAGEPQIFDGFLLIAAARKVVRELRDVIIE